MASTSPTATNGLAGASASTAADAAAIARRRLLETASSHLESATNSNPAMVEAQRAKANFVYREEQAPGIKLELDLKRILLSTASPYQKIDVIETTFGKTLVTDGKTQSSQFDEFAYHESLVHPAMLKFAESSAIAASATSGADRRGRGPRRVFIGGGGELATAREVLKHASVEKVVMVDLDEAIVATARELLPEWGGDAVLQDPRFELVVGDAHAYLFENNTAAEDQFDVIIMDISDPVEAGPGVMLYTEEFYKQAADRCLSKPHGVLVTQSGMAEAIPSAGAFEHCGGGGSDDDPVDPSCFAPIHNTLRTAFDCVVPYSINIPSYGSDWGFNVAFQQQSISSRNGNAGADVQDATTKKAGAEGEWQVPKQGRIDELIERHVTGGSSVLRFYDGTTHVRMFALTKPLRESMRRDDRVITRSDPIFMY